MLSPRDDAPSVDYRGQCGGMESMLWNADLERSVGCWFNRGPGSELRRVNNLDSR